jgi:hypothetical protein
VVGRKYIDHQATEDEHPKIRLIALRGLTDLSDRNAEGMGLAEFCLARYLAKVDKQLTQVNAETGRPFHRRDDLARLPVSSRPAPATT